jgi:hypothetical protein
MDNILELFQTMFFHNAGVVPLSLKSMHFDYNRILAELSPDEARKMKRKFRKMWRKYLKSYMFNVVSPHLVEIVRPYGFGEDSPTKLQKYRRKKFVYNQVTKLAKAFYDQQKR